jgi:hypothetical protein
LNRWSGVEHECQGAGIVLIASFSLHSSKNLGLRGWGIPLNDHTLDVTLGGIAQKPGVVDGKIALCEYLCLTLSFDHALIDGAPAARFAQRLKELIEQSYGLNEPEAGSCSGCQSASSGVTTLSP